MGQKPTTQLTKEGAKRTAHLFWETIVYPQGENDNRRITTEASIKKQADLELLAWIPSPFFRWKIGLPFNLATDIMGLIRDSPSFSLNKKGLMN